jgi:hypothetical protein
VEKISRQLALFDSSVRGLQTKSETDPYIPASEDEGRVKNCLKAA